MRPPSRALSRESPPSRVASPSPSRRGRLLERPPGADFVQSVSGFGRRDLTRSIAAADAMPPTTPRSEGRSPRAAPSRASNPDPTPTPRVPRRPPRAKYLPSARASVDRPSRPPLPAHPRLPPSRRSDDEDPVDHRPDLEEACKPKCAKFIAAYDACVARVEKDTTGEAHCTGQYFDMWGCTDKCVAPNLFKNTK